MILKDSIEEVIKKELLKKLGNPTYYYKAWLNDDGWYLTETKIETLDFEKKYSGGYMIKINGYHVYESYFLFDKEKAQEYVNNQNIEFFTNQIKTNKEYLDTIDEKVIKSKSEAKAKIEIAQNRLKKLGVKQ